MLLCASPARANNSDEVTYFTFSAPVALPGVALPAGTYMFRRPDSESARHLVQVLSQDGLTVYGTFLTVPSIRRTPTDEPVVILEETRRGTPEVIDAWFYPGSLEGDEFLYAKKEIDKPLAGLHGN